MGEKEPINTESPKIKEINNFFEGLEKVDNGKLLGSIFQKLTLDKSLQFKRDNILIGETEDKEDSPVISLRDLRGAGEIWLQVSRNEKRFNQSPGSGDLILIAGRVEGEIIPDLKSEIDSYSPSDKYGGLLKKILAEVNLRFKKARGMKDG